MKVIKYPKKDEWTELLERPVMDQLSLEKKVRKVLQKVKAGGDKALKKFTKDFDGARIRKLVVTEKEISRATEQVPGELKEAIKLAAGNITAFHSSQLGQE
ncbi:MAG TPA: histidinol dehydrogenase, partial [Chitinophagaceae bacterium]|nr:histidinol dehydrogenase [Chitinophagaceae bacterium]